MKHTFLFACTLMLLSCSISTTEAAEGRQKLAATDFNTTISKIDNERIIDVRTPEEFSEGHIAAAQNINFQSADFKEQIAALPKEEPIMVYCLSGGRSGEAASTMEKMGFKNIYELDGGMMKWKSAGLPVEIASEDADMQKAKAPGMSKEQYDAAVMEKEMVLVDFYADWCKPCKQMEPMLKDLAESRKENLKVLRINADNNEEISQIMGVDALPSLFLYVKGKLVWQKTGLTAKDEIETQFGKN